MTESALPVPVYSIYDRDIPRQHVCACVIVNPIGCGPEVRGRKPEDTLVAGCEGSACLIPAREAGNG
jgi:hypothetical protein